MANINQIIQRIEKHLPQRSNRFEAALFLPNSPNYALVPDVVSLPVVSFQTPEKSIITKDYSYYGINRKIPYKRQFGDLSITFLADEEGIIQTVIESWMDTLINPFNDTINNANAINTLKGKVVLTQMGTGPEQEENFLPQYIFYEAFPRNILPFTFSSEEKNAHLKYTVLFAFKQYEFISGTYRTNPAGEEEI